MNTDIDVTEMESNMNMISDRTEYLNLYYLRVVLRAIHTVRFLSQ